MENTLIYSEFHLVLSLYSRSRKDLDQHVILKFLTEQAKAEVWEWSNEPSDMAGFNDCCPSLQLTAKAVKPMKTDHELHQALEPVAEALKIFCKVHNVYGDLIMKHSLYMKPGATHETMDLQFPGLNTGVACTIMSRKPPMLLELHADGMKTDMSLDFFDDLWEYEPFSLNDKLLQYVRAPLKLTMSVKQCLWLHPKRPRALSIRNTDDERYLSVAVKYWVPCNMQECMKHIEESKESDFELNAFTYKGGVVSLKYGSQSLQDLAFEKLRRLKNACDGNKEEAAYKLMVFGFTYEEAKTCLRDDLKDILNV